MSIEKETTCEKPALIAGELTASFGLQRYLSPPKMKFDLVPVLDLIVLALMISLLFTRYLILPGVRVDLPKTELSIQQDASKVTVLTIANGGMLFFDGSVYEQNSIGRAFRQYVESKGDKVEPTVLLVKAEASMELQKFLDLCQMAQDAGFGEVQIAADPTKDSQGLTAEPLSRQNEDVVFPAR